MAYQGITGYIAAWQAAPKYKRTVLLAADNLEMIKYQSLLPQ
jgi:hypothetical protein